MVDNEIASYKGTNPNESQIAKNLLLVFSKKFLGLDKRTYDMAQLATKDMLRIV